MSRRLRKGCLQLADRLIDMIRLQQCTASIRTDIHIVRVYFERTCVKFCGFGELSLVVADVAQFSKRAKTLRILLQGVFQPLNFSGIDLRSFLIDALATEEFYALSHVGSARR